MDLTKFILAYRFGGTFLDSNIIVFDKFKKSQQNWFAIEHLGSNLISKSAYHINNYGNGKELAHDGIS